MDTWHHERNTSGVTVEMHGNVRHLVCPECHATRPMTAALAKQVRAVGCWLVRGTGAAASSSVDGPAVELGAAAVSAACPTWHITHRRSFREPAAHCSCLPRPPAQIRSKVAVPCGAPGCSHDAMRFKVMMYDDGEGELGQGCRAQLERWHRASARLLLLPLACRAACLLRTGLECLPPALTGLASAHQQATQQLHTLKRQCCLLPLCCSGVHHTGRRDGADGRGCEGGRPGEGGRVPGSTRP